MWLDKRCRSRSSRPMGEGGGGAGGRGRQQEKSQVKQPFPSGGCRAGFREKGRLYPCNKRNTANKVTPSFRQEQEAVWKQAASGLLSSTLAFVSKSLARGHVSLILNKIVQKQN